MFGIANKKTGIVGSRAVAVLAVLILGSAALSATMNVRVETDKTVYKVGDTVAWTIYAWASSGDNLGVAFVSVDLDDANDIILNAPLRDEIEPEFLGTSYGVAEGFMVTGWGEPDPDDPDTPDLLSISVMQIDKQPDKGNDGQDNHILAKGSYTVSTLGEHALDVNYYGTGAHYWLNDDIYDYTVFAFETLKEFPGSFSVVIDADINGDYSVNLVDVSILAAWWHQTGCANAMDCGGADVNGDDVVDLTDAAMVADWWLWCDNAPGNPYCGQI